MNDLGVKGHLGVWCTSGGFSSTLVPWETVMLASLHNHVSTPMSIVLFGWEVRSGRHAVVNSPPQVHQTVAAAAVHLK